MDVSLLPKRALVDTGVLIRALGERPEDPWSADCQDFVKAMVVHQRDILVSAPSIAELLRGNPSTPLPTTKHVIVVSFDDRAARVLGTTFPQDVLKKVSGTSTGPLSYFKYDALIAACAIRHRADVLVTLDARMKAQLPAGLKVVAPDSFRTKQLPLPSVDGNANA